MIIIDMNQISLASLMMNMHMNKTTEVDEDMVRHMILNSVRMYRSMFKEKYGEVVLAYDSRHYWRRDIFPQYKMNRKKGREKDNLDWNNIFEVLNKIKAEFKDNLPYKFLEVYGAEADDIIGALCKKYPTEKIMIISGDKDFIQLQKYDNVSQYSPITKKHINGQNPDTYIKEHILKGDSSDGVPNVLSPDHTFTDGLRQRPLSKKKIEAWSKSETGMNNEVKRNFQRNQKLIDLDNTPEELRNKILADFNDAPCGDRSKLLNYFIHNRLKELTESIGDF
jgi:5'-3' exonuclease|tara:strand:- start:825 stop:1664 length:840 start_codon:yes stop_codon:yes gene_type:complete